MFREPEVEVPKAIKKKTDPTAPARSSIRRQRSVRYPTQTHRDRQSSRPPQSYHHDRYYMHALRARDRFRVVSAGSDAERFINIEIAADQAHAEASRQRRLESGRATLRNALSYEQPHQSTNMRRGDPHPSSMMRRPTPSSTSFRHPSRHSRHRPVVPETGHDGPQLTRTPPPAYIPLPPYTSVGQSNRSSPDVLQPANADTSLTPRFAPAHVLAQFESGLDQPRFQHQQSNYEDLTTSDSMLDELPPLRRVSRRYSPSRPNRVPSVHGVIDGLGDRWRSVSPDTDPWEILLSTMPPDERLPSTTSSSFRSNEDPSAYDESGDLAESMGNGTNAYPVICDTTESDFTEAEDQAIIRTLGQADQSGAHTHRQIAENRSASAPHTGGAPHRRESQLSRQQQATIDAVNAGSRRIQRHLNELEMLMPSGGTSSGHPGRERL